MTGLIGRAARLGDRINPVVVKETRQAVNSRLVAGTLLLFLLGQFVVLSLMVGGRELARDPDDLNLRAGRDVFVFVQGILLGTCLLLIPALTGGRLAAERSDVNVDLLFISSLTPRAIVAGKFLAAAALALLIFSACAPFMTFAYLLRGLDVPTILVVLALDFVAVLAGTMFALLIAAFPVNRGFRIVLAIGGFVALAYVFAGAVALTSQWLQNGFGGGVDFGSWEFWAGFAGLAALVLGFTGLMFVWATALITPPTANRALLVRAYTLVFWLATGVGCAVWSRYNVHPGPVFAWGFAGVALAVLQILTAVSERDGWGPRVARRIPRNPLLRGPAFLLFSGAAGGLIFGTLVGLFSVLGTVAWHEWGPSARMWPTPWWEPTRYAGLILAYTYCYGLTATLARRSLRRSAAFRPEYTWVVGLILFGIGCTLPYVVHTVVYPRPHQMHQDQILWMYLPNPFVSIDKAVELDAHFELLVLFLGGWALVVTLLNARWLLRQVATFRPPAARAAAVADGAE